MQYMPGMHNMGVDPRGMQSMYNSALQSIPTHAHMHPHSRSYGPDMGMGHHGMMNQVFATPHRPFVGHAIIYQLF